MDFSKFWNGFVQKNQAEVYPRVQSFLKLLQSFKRKWVGDTDYWIAAQSVSQWHICCLTIKIVWLLSLETSPKIELLSADWSISCFQPCFPCCETVCWTLLVTISDKFARVCETVCDILWNIFGQWVAHSVTRYETFLTVNEILVFLLGDNYTSPLRFALLVRLHWAQWPTLGRIWPSKVSYLKLESKGVKNVPVQENASIFAKKHQYLMNKGQVPQSKELICQKCLSRLMSPRLDLNWPRQ